MASNRILEAVTRAQSGLSMTDNELRSRKGAIPDLRRAIGPAIALLVELGAGAEESEGELIASCGASGPPVGDPVPATTPGRALADAVASGQSRPATQLVERSPVLRQVEIETKNA